MKNCDLNPVDFLFYKLYKIIGRTNKWEPMFAAIVLVAVVIGLLVELVVFFLIHRFAQSIVLARWQGIVLGIICISLLSHYFYRGKRYQKIIDRYKYMNKHWEVTTDIITITILVLFFILFMVVVQHL